MMLRRLLLAALIALTPSLALAQVNSPDFSIAAYVRNALAGNVTIGGNLTVGGIIIDTSGGITVGSPTGGSQGTGTINVAVNYFKNGIATPSTVSLPLALAAGNISCPTCVLISGTAHGDSAYAILSTDRYVYTNAAFTAARIWTLPAANSLAAGTTIWVQDAQGTVTSTNTLTIQRAGADTVNVSGTNIVMTGAGGGTQFTTDGVSNWGTAVQTVTTGGTGRQTLTNHGVLIGAATNPVTQLAVGANGTLLLGATGADPVFNAMSGDATIAAGGGLTLATVNGNVGSFGSTTQCVTLTTNAKGLITAASAATCAPAIGSVTGLGTGVATALGVNVGTAGAFVVNGGALGTPSSGTLTNATGLPLSTGVTGTLAAAQEPAHTGDVTNTAGSLAMTLAAGNAGNLNSGTLLAARMPALTGDCTSTVNTVATTCTKINGVDQTTAWASYTPTLSCGTGTLTTSSATGAFKQIGKTTFVRFVATITTNGTCATSLIVTLPAAPVTSQEMMIAVRDVTNGNIGSGRINSGAGTVATITRFDGVYMAVSGSFIVGTGVYEAN